MSAGTLLLPPSPPRPPSAPASGSGGPTIRRFTVEEYHRMIEAGVLTEDDDVELLEGQVVYKMPRNPPHDESLENTDYAIRGVLPTDARVRIQSAITLTDGEPEPDLMVCGPLDQRRGRKPTAADALLVVEVADTSLESDRTTKLRMYAGAAIPVYWIVNVRDRQVEVYTGPSGPADSPGYATQAIHPVDQRVPIVIRGQTVAELAVASLLPEA
jgi:Uma2 family endonuclease